METIHLNRVREVQKEKQTLEAALQVRINVLGSRVEIEGSAIAEYDAVAVFEAINFGFSVQKALLLRNEEMAFKKIHIRDYTKRDLRTIKARLIGTNGKTRRLISQITGCEVLIKEGDVGLLGISESVEDTERAVIRLIRGTKQANTYRYLEKRNREKKESTSFEV
jgi:ribosomal RNA assembly protein